MSDVAFDLLFGPDFVTTTTSWGLADAAAATAATAATAAAGAACLESFPYLGYLDKVI